MFLFCYSCSSIDIDSDIVFDTVVPPSVQELTQMLEESFQMEPNITLDNGLVLTVEQDSFVLEGKYISEPLATIMCLFLLYRVLSVM